MNALLLALCLASPLANPLPNPTLTPGATLPVTKADICIPGYAKRVRNVPVAVKRRVYRLYGVLHPAPGEYEVDHLISLELGGSNDIKNLFLEPYFLDVGGLEEGAHEKDRLENRLHRLVCTDQLSLQDAQHMISTDWVKAYKQFLGPLPPVTHTVIFTN